MRDLVEFLREWETKTASAIRLGDAAGPRHFEIELAMRQVIALERIADSVALIEKHLHNLDIASEIVDELNLSRGPHA